MGLVALDVGQSAVRGLARTGTGDRRVAGDGVAEPLTVPGAPERVAARLSVFIGRLAEGPIQTLGVGLSGIDRADDATVDVACRLAALTGARTVRVASDAVTWHLAVLDGAAGVVAAVGTGSVALAADGSGRCARADGWGHTLGDQASGFAIGRAGLASALEAYDRRGGSGVLLARATERFGDGPAIAAVVHGSASPVATVASFAPDVLAAADEGDPVAGAIWDAAGHALGRMVIGAWRGVFPDGVPVPVAVVGSLAEAGERLIGPCRTELSPHGLVPSRPDVDALEGAARLGLQGVAAFPGFAIEVQGGW